MNAPNMAKFKPSDEQLSAARSLMMAMAHRDYVTPIVTAYQTDILARHRWPKAAKWAEIGSGREGHEEWMAQPILTPRDTYLLGEVDFAQYMDECRNAQAAAKLVTESRDHCPKLVAEDLVWKAQRALVDAMKPVTGLEWGDITRGTMDQTRKYIELSLKLLAPFVGAAEQILGAQQQIEEAGATSASSPRRSRPRM